MSSVIAYGTTYGTGMVPQKPKRVWVPDRGWTSTQQFIGPRSAVNATIAGLQAQRAEVSDDGGDPVAVLTANYGYDVDEGTDVGPRLLWERQIIRSEKSIYEHDTISALPDALITAIRTQVLANDATEITTGGTSGELVTANSALQLLLRGVESKIVEQPVVILTEIYSAQFNINIARNNVGKILSYSQMQSLEDAPANKVLDNKTTPSGLASFARFGYLKGEPTVTQQAANQWHVRIEWQAGIWPDLLYEDAS